MARVLIPLVDGFEEIETFTIVDVLRRAGIEAITAGLSGNIVQGAHGVKVYADDRMIDTNIDKFDAIVLPGGYPGYQNLMRSQAVNLALHEFAKKGKLIGAICGAPLVLAKAGLLKDRRATVYPGMEKELDMPRDDRVVIDKNIITSQGPGTAMEFAIALVRKLVGESKAEEVKKQLLA